MAGDGLRAVGGSFRSGGIRRCFCGGLRQPAGYCNAHAAASYRASNGDAHAGTHRHSRPYRHANSGTHRHSRAYRDANAGTHRHARAHRHANAEIDSPPPRAYRNANADR